MSVKTWQPQTILSIACVAALILFALAPAFAVPVVLNHTETAQPGDVVYFEGTWGSTIQVAYEFIDTNGAESEANATHLTPICTNSNNAHNTGSYVSVRIPYSARIGLWAVWLNDGTGWTTVPQAYINQAHGTHCEFSEIAPNFPFYVFGRNMILAKYSPAVTFVDTKTNKSYVGTVYPVNSTSYYMQVSAPSTVAVGDPYTVKVSSGSGGKLGASVVEEGTTVQWASAPDPVTTIAGTPVPWNLNVPWQADYLKFCNNVINASLAPYSVTAGGFTTEAAAQANAGNLQNAMNAASTAGGGVVYLPAGNYAFDYNAQPNWHHELARQRRSDGRRSDQHDFILRVQHAADEFGELSVPQVGYVHNRIP